MSKRKLSIAICLALATAAPAARAQWAVIDVNAIAQLARQVQTLEQQLATARNQLETASMQFQSMTGSRGMERLLAGTVRNYLPADWSQLTGVLQGAGGGYPGLAASYQGLLNGNAVLTAQGLAAVSYTHLDVYKRQAEELLRADRHARSLIRPLPGAFLSERAS